MTKSYQGDPYRAWAAAEERLMNAHETIDNLRVRLSALEQAARELQIFLKWEAGILSEGQASKILGVDRLKARTMKMDALAAQLREPKEG